MLASWWKSKIRMLEGKRGWVRLFPNPGVAIVVGKYRYKYSTHKGYNKELVK